MHLKACPPPLCPVKLDDMPALKLTDGSILDFHESPLTDECFERKTTRDGQVHWYRVVSDAVVTV